MFAPYTRKWKLTVDGEPIHAHSSDLLPVLRNGNPAMLKIARTAEERRGNMLMAWWDGNGSARVLEHDGPALLMERATGQVSLAEMAKSARDDEATRILCQVTARLHSHGGGCSIEVEPLSTWFSELLAASAAGAVIGAAASTAADLLASQIDIVVLHGDIHHGNVLDFGTDGWRVIDPKGLRGERTFDFANMLRNPDFQTATALGRFRRQASLIASEAGLDRERLIKWVMAFAGLSAAWHLDKGDHPQLDLAILEIAGTELAAL